MTTACVIRVINVVNFCEERFFKLFVDNKLLPTQFHNNLNIIKSIPVKDAKVWTFL